MNRPGSVPARSRAVAIAWVGAVSLFLVSTGLVWADQGPRIEGTVTIMGPEGQPKDRHDGVVVFLDELENPPPTSGARRRVVMRQLHKRFIPRELPIQVGTTVEFPNDDAIQHNVFSLSRASPFDLGLYASGESRAVTFSKTGLVKIYCNIHPDMVAFVPVLANRYFTVTDQHGRFAIADLPLGKAILRTWYVGSRRHPQQPIHVTEDGIQDRERRPVKEFNLKVQEETVSFQHPNKFGQDYPLEY